MSAARNDCIWFDQCGPDECGKVCDYYSPFDESELNEKEYFKILKENAGVYAEIANDYADKEADRNEP